MANANGWGDGASNNTIGWGKGADNAIGWGAIHADSYAGLTDIVGTAAVDADAQAFITAAAITDPTQQSAINTLVVDLKGYSIWTKMQALYPFVGGTAVTHKWNLKNPLDTDAAFRVLWSGGVTHSSNGVQFGGVNGYGNTFLTPSSSLTLNSSHISFYSRTNFDGGWDLACQDDHGISNKTLYLGCRIGGNFVGSIQSADANRVITANADSRGLYSVSRSSPTSLKSYKNGALQTTNTTSSVNGQSTIPLLIGALNYKSGGGVTSVSGYSSKQCAFASIGDGLTDAEVGNLTTAVQAFQTTLGRSIGTQTVSDADAQAFVTAADIQDQVEANAINNLVIGMKADGTWTKMKAVYPFVGGTASTHKFNLKNPLDTDAAFRLTFSGGWTHSSTGALPNGTNAFADTKLNARNILTANNASFGIYIPTTHKNVSGHGCWNLAVTERCNLLQIAGYYSQISSGTTAAYFNSNQNGFIQGSRINATSNKLYRNGSLLATNTTTETAPYPLANFYFSYINNSGLSTDYGSNELRFSYLSDGLTDTDATNLYNRVQTFNTALARQV